MAASKAAKDKHVDRLGCPVVGREVVVTARYETGEGGEDRLSYFACAMEGRCGISLWDPCPLYVYSLEMRAPRNRK